MSDNSEMLDAEETSLAAVTDDSCTLKYIEIVPLDRPADDYCKPEFIERVVEVKPEDLQDVKQEPADDSDSEATHYSVKVSLRLRLKIQASCPDKQSDSHSHLASAGMCVSGPSTQGSDLLVHFKNIVDNVEDGLKRELTVFSSYASAQMLGTIAEVCQHEESSGLDSSGINYIHVEAVHHLQPVTVLEKLDVTRVKKEYNVHICSGCSCCINDGTNEDATHSFSDNSRRQLQSSDSTTQSVYSTDDVQVDDSDVLDAAWWDHTYCSTGRGNISEDSKRSFVTNDVTDATADSTQTQIICEVCGEKFDQLCTLKQHIFVHYTQCDVHFAQSNSLDMQTFIAANKYPICCKVCGKKFSQSNALKSHMRTHSGERPFCCTVCSKKYRSRCGLRDHMLTHTGERRHCCGMCNKNFAHPNGLKDHMRIHTGERPFCCKDCSKTFTQSSSLKKHMLTHGSYRPFCCEVCNKPFSWLCSLKRHIQVHRAVHSPKSQGPIHPTSPVPLPSVPPSPSTVLSSTPAAKRSLKPARGVGSAVSSLVGPPANIDFGVL